VGLGVSSDSNSQQAPFCSLSMKSPHHFLRVLGEHQNKVAENAVKGSFLLDHLLAIAASDAELVFFVVFLFLDIDRYSLQKPSNGIFRHFYHFLRKVDCQIGRFFVFDAHY
jgi:hypothetical protein